MIIPMKEMHQLSILTSLQVQCTTHVVDHCKAVKIPYTHKKTHKIYWEKQSYMITRYLQTVRERNRGIQKEAEKYMHYKIYSKIFIILFNEFTLIIYK